MTAWHHEAACAGWPTELWFPTKGAVVDPAVMRLCHTCPVRQECLQACIREEGAIRYGMRGGLYPSQREELAKGAAA